MPPSMRSGSTGRICEDCRLPGGSAPTGLVPATTTVVSRVFSIEERGRDLFDAVERLDLEGIVAKRKGDAYRPGTVWYKIKSRTYTQGDGRWELFQKK
jgi:hypothetical protein